MRFIMVVSALLVGSVAPLDGRVHATLGRSASGVPELRVRNAGNAGLSAYAVALKHRADAERPGELVVFFDVLIEDAAPLSPEEERTVPLLMRSRPGAKLEELFEPSVVTAGVQTDGSITGDPVLVARLLVRRSNMLLAVETALEMLVEAGRRNVPREQLSDQFRKAADAGWRWYIPPEQHVGRNLYRSLMDRIRSLPQGEPGSAFPPSGFVAEESAALNRRRVALLQGQPSLPSSAVVPVP